MGRNYTAQADDVVIEVWKWNFEICIFLYAAGHLPNTAMSSGSASERI
jgi:hypothetical protein